MKVPAATIIVVAIVYAKMINIKNHAERRSHLLGLSLRYLSSIRHYVSELEGQYLSVINEARLTISAVTLLQQL
jgi:hypothetical protein